MSTESDPSAVPIPKVPPDGSQRSDVKQQLAVKGSKLPEAGHDMSHKNDPCAAPVPKEPPDGG